MSLYQRQIDKHWQKRYFLFEKFDDGIKIFEESWANTPPECVAEHISSQIRCETLMDAYCGVGSMVMKFANTCTEVLAVDDNVCKLECLHRNANIYGIDNFQIIHTNFLTVSETIKPDVIFIHPNERTMISGDKIQTFLEL